jgi:hypothetical protein
MEAITPPSHRQAPSGGIKRGSLAPGRVGRHDASKQLDLSYRSVLESPGFDDAVETLLNILISAGQRRQPDRTGIYSRSSSRPSPPALTVSLTGKSVLAPVPPI